MTGLPKSGERGREDDQLGLVRRLGEIARQRRSMQEVT